MASEDFVKVGKMNNGMVLIMAITILAYSWLQKISSRWVK